MHEYKKKNSMTREIYRTLKRIRRSITVVLALIALFVVGVYVSDFFKKSTNFNPDMLDRCMDYINKEMDKILLLDTRPKQNRVFRALQTNLPIEPVRMSTTTAVFKYTHTSTPVILKRIIWNTKNGLNEDEICTVLKEKNRYLVNALMSTRSTRYIQSPTKPDTREKQTLIWIFFEYMDVKISERHVKGKEEIIRDIMRDALLGLKYLHDNNYAHLDIKIANIMGHTQKNGRIVYKLIDFGYTQHFNEKTAVIPRKNYGTYPFKAPEVIQANIHGVKADIWSMGATAWYLSLGNILFYDSAGNKHDSSYMRFITSKSNTPSGRNKHRFTFRPSTSPELKDFVKRAMVIDWKLRPTVDELLSHPFIMNEKLGHSYVSESFDSYIESTTENEM